MEIGISYAGDKQFRIKIRDHEFVTDVPVERGGRNAGPTATELFIASMGACMGLYGTRYMKTAKLDPEGFSVKVDWDFDKNKPRVERIDVTVSVPNADLGARKKALISAMEKCVIHNALHDPPKVSVNIAGDA